MLASLVKTRFYKTVEIKFRHCGFTLIFLWLAKKVTAQHDQDMVECTTDQGSPEIKRPRLDARPESFGRRLYSHMYCPASRHTGV